MTRPLSVELQAHIAQETTTLAYLWRITRIDEQIITYTDHDEDITYDGETYEANNSFAPTAISFKDDLSTDNLDVIGILGRTPNAGQPVGLLFLLTGNQAGIDTNDITEPDLAAGKYDFAAVEIMLINYADVSQDVMPLLRGWLGRVIIRGGQFTAEIRSLSQKLQTNIGRIYTSSCDAILGDTRCGKDITAFTFSATVTDITDNGRFNASALSQAAGYFTGGQVNWISGLNNDLSMEVKDFLDTEVGLALPMPDTIKVGDTFDIIAGCDKLKQTCIDKFDNILNFRGFPDIPGTDKILETSGTFTSDDDT